MLLQAMEWKHVWIGMEQVKARARRLKNLTPAIKIKELARSGFFRIGLSQPLFGFFNFLCSSIGTLQLIRLQCLNDDRKG